MFQNPNGLFYQGESAQIGQDDTHEQAAVQALQQGQAVQDAAEEINAEQVKLEQAISEVGGLEKQAGNMQQAVDNGQALNATGAQAVQMAVESAMLRLGFRVTSASDLPVLSFESYSGGSSDFNSTKTSCEGLWEKIKEIWEAIKAKVKAFFQKVIDFFGKFFDGTDSVKKHAEKVQAKASERSGWTTKQAEIDFGGAAKTFIISGKFSVKEADAIFNNHHILTKNVVGAYNNMSTAVQALNDFLVKKDDAVLDKAWGKITDTAQEMMKGTIGFKTEKKGDDDILIAGPFINGETLVAKMNSKAGAFSMQFEGREKKVENTSGSLPSTKAVEQICTSVIDLMKTTEEYKTALPKIKTLNTELVKLCEAALGVASAVVKTADNNTKLEAGLTKVRKACTDVISVGARVTIMLPSWNVKLGNSALSMCDAWLSNLEDKSKK